MISSLRPRNTGLQKGKKYVCGIGYVFNLHICTESGFPHVDISVDNSVPFPALHQAM